MKQQRVAQPGQPRRQPQAPRPPSAGCPAPCTKTPDWVTATFPRTEAVSTPHETPHVERLVAVLQGQMSRADLMAVLAMQRARDRVREATRRSRLLLSPRQVVEEVNAFSAVGGQLRSCAVK